MKENPPSHQARPTRWNKWGTAMVISGVITVIAPLFGLLGTVFGMVGAFNELENEGGADPEALSSDIGIALETTAGGLVVSVIGFILSIIFLILFILKLNRDKASAHEVAISE